MNFNLSEEQAMLKDGVERFIQQEYGFEARREIAAGDEGFSRARWQDYAELGWPGSVCRCPRRSAALRVRSWRRPS